MDFDPSRPCRTFEPPPRRRARRRAAEILFVEQEGRRFVVKSFADAGDLPDDASRRAKREIAAIAAFRAAGAAALEPVLWPLETLVLDVDGGREAIDHAMVFPFLAAPTLYDTIAAASDPRPILREAGARIRARHDAAASLEAIHSDGSAHNVFADWTWFDFCEAHVADQIREAKGLEVLRFVSSVVEITPAGRTRSHVGAFCTGYGDENVLTLALDYSRMAEPHMRVQALMRMLGRPDKLLAFWMGNRRHFRRVRTWDALDHALRD